MNKKDPLALVLERNTFYKRFYYLVLAAFALSLLVIGLLTWVFFYMNSNPRPPLYFVTDKVGRLMETTPVSRPNMSEEEVVKWTIEATEAAYSFDFVNYRSQFQSTRKYFTDFGWRNYLNAIEQSNNLIAVRQRRMVQFARVVYQPELVTKGVLSGAYAWKFKLYLLVTYMDPPYDQQSTYTNPLTVTVIVQRQPELQSYKGLGVLQFIGEIASAPPRQTQPISETPGG